MRFIQFSYNRQELIKLANYAAEVGISFEIVNGSHNPQGANYGGSTGELYYQKQMNNAGLAPFLKNEHKYCAMLFESIAIDANGDIFLCCATANFDFLKIGSFFEMPLHKILVERYVHPLCRTCNCPLHRKITNDEKKLIISSLEKSLQ